MVESLTIILSSGAYQSERAFTALRFVLTALVEGLRVNLFLTEDGVFLAKKGQNPDDFKNAGEWLALAIKEGAKVLVCGICAGERGMGEADFIEGAKKGTMHDLVAWVKESDRTLFL
ncbi:MAG: DsrE/DsrF/TusD sulfur relay family protein [Candidatus Bathyarchaeia archaeon]